METETRWWLLGAIIPALIPAALEHYRWSSERRERRERERERAFKQRMNKALDEALERPSTNLQVGS